MKVLQLTDPVNLSVTIHAHPGPSIPSSYAVWITRSPSTERQFNKTTRPPFKKNTNAFQCMNCVWLAGWDRHVIVTYLVFKHFL